MNTWEMGTLTKLRDKDIYSSDGKKIGSVRDIYYDETSRQPELVGVGTGFLGMKERVIPVEALTDDGDHLTVAFPKDKIEHEPDFDMTDDYIMNQDELKLSAHFGLTGRNVRNAKRPYGVDYDNDFEALDADKPDDVIEGDSR